MTKSPASGDLRPLPFLHTLATLALAVGWAYYCWRAGPLRAPGSRARHHDSVLGLDRALDTLTGSLGDLALGFGTILLFAIGTGIYVRRFQVWMDARSSGEAVAYGSADLKDRALAANAHQEGRR